MNCRGCVCLPTGAGVGFVPRMQRGVRHQVRVARPLGMPYYRDGLYRPAPQLGNAAAFWPLSGEKPWYLDVRVWGAGALGAVFGFVLAKVF